MPVDSKRYPVNWKAISLRIRERDGQKCKWCGVANHALIYRQPKGREYLYVLDNSDGYITPDGSYLDASDAPEWLNDAKLVRVILTVAHHPDPDPMNCTDDNLQSLCQKCHNKLDAPMRAKHAAETRRIKRELDTGQKRMF